MKTIRDWRTLTKELDAQATEARARISRSFFKTGQGQYGEGDQFIGITMPDLRRIVKEYEDLDELNIIKLLEQPIHEYRMAALVIWARQMSRADDSRSSVIASQYLVHRARMNNWDLVDASAPYILGPYFLNRSRAPLYRLAKARSLWDRRIAIVTTLGFIRKGDLKDTFTIAKLLMKDSEDLIHKATGWMLREAGKKDEQALRQFLDRHASQMPRTMLRYAIERFSLPVRRSYLLRKIKK